MDEEDGGGVDGDLTGFGDGKLEDGCVLDKVDVADDMMVAALAGPLFGRPGFHGWC